jgi:hypothetical protein
MTKVSSKSELEVDEDVMGYFDWLQRVGDLIAPPGALTTAPIGTKSYPTYRMTGEFVYDAFWRTCAAIVRR